MIEPTIIDGVDVSGCEFAEESATTPKCQINGYIHCDGYNCRYKQLQRKIKQNDELTKIIQERNEEIKNLNYTLYEDRELTTDLVKANLKISKLERTLSSVTNKFKYDWQNKTAECEELKKKKEENETFYLRKYANKDSECLELQHKLRIATEALDIIANQNFNTPNKICNLAEKELVPCTNNCKYCLQAYAQRALEQIESEEQ